MQRRGTAFNPLIFYILHSIQVMIFINDDNHVCCCRLSCIQREGDDIFKKKCDTVLCHIQVIPLGLYQRLNCRYF